MGVQITERMMDHGFAGFVCVALPSIAPVENPANFINARIDLMAQDITNPFLWRFVNSRGRTVSAYAEAVQKTFVFLKS